MNTISKAATKTDVRVLLSSLWIFIMINMLKADILSLFIPGDIAAEIATVAGSTPIPIVMLVGAILMQISTVMIVLARVLPYRANRWSNILVSIWTIVFIWGGMSNLETLALLLIIWFAWTWKIHE